MCNRYNATCTTQLCLSCTPKFTAVGTVFVANSQVLQHKKNGIIDIFMQLATGCSCRASFRRVCIHHSTTGVCREGACTVCREYNSWLAAYRTAVIDDVVLSHQQVVLLLLFFLATRVQGGRIVKKDWCRPSRHGIAACGREEANTRQATAATAEEKRGCEV